MSFEHILEEMKELKLLSDFAMEENQNLRYKPFNYLHAYEG